MGDGDSHQPTRRQAIVIIAALIFAILGLFAAVIRPGILTDSSSSGASLHEERERIANRVGNKFIRQTFRDPFRPDRQQFTRSLIKTGKTRGTDYVYGALWEADNYSLWTGVYFTRNATDVYRILWSIQGRQPFVSAPVDATDVREAVGRVTTLKPQNINCTLGVRNHRACDSYWRTAPGSLSFAEKPPEMGVYIVDRVPAPGRIKFVMAGCKRFKHSAHYGASSCIISR